MLWIVLPDNENTDYDMYDGAIIKADTKKEAEDIAINKFNTTIQFDDTKQIWTAEPSLSMNMVFMPLYCFRLDNSSAIYSWKPYNK